MAPASHPLWTDYVAAFGTLVGIVIAGIALLMAKRSAADATRSAKAAEDTARAAEGIGKASTSTLQAATEQLRLATLEHERLETDRARRPVVEQIEISEVQPRPGEEAPAGIFRIGFKNVGDRELVDAMLTILVGPGCGPLLTDRWGNEQPDRSKDETRERWPGVDGGPQTFDYIPLRLKVPVGESRVQYVCATRFGRFPLRVKLFSAALEGTGPWIDAWIDVSPDGTATIARLSDAGSGQYEGHCVAFE